MHLAADDRRRDAADSVGLPRAYGPPILFAVARDSRCIFTCWSIDWLLVFENAMPVDRQVYLRLYRADGTEEKIVAVEPMAGAHYVSTSEAHRSYRLEIGYYQPADIWHSVATSKEVVMPPSGIAETGDVDLVTIPFHLSFQQLVDLLGPVNDAELATAISQFQKRALSREERTRLSRDEKRILRRLDISLFDIAAARRAFDAAGCKNLARRFGTLIAFSPTSPTRGFHGDWVSAGS